MKLSPGMMSLAALPALLGACVAAVASPQDEALDVRRAMVEGVNPAAIAIWDVGNTATDADGGLDPALMDDATWAKLHEAAQSLAIYAHRMAEAQVIRASGPDLVEGNPPEGVSSREQIQAMIDADPQGFRAHSAEMERQARAIADAAAARDLKVAGELVSTFDGNCQGCHEGYWYLPE